MADSKTAKELLASGDYTCVVCCGDTIYTATDRGIKPLLNWFDSHVDLTGFSAADRVVGRATAFLYVLLGVRAVYARVMSNPAAQVLRSYHIEVSADCFTEGIINRRGDGPCPFEAAVLDLQDPQDALRAIRRKLADLSRT